MTSDITRAAEILEEYAQLLREMNTIDGEWPVALDEYTDNAKRDHDEYLVLANRLRKAVF
jgi:hypothetical protein